jgi:hypothetical protein
VARIRTIKPEFWTSEQVMGCAPITRLLFIGLWNFADDQGRLPLSAKSIKAKVFPSDGFPSETVLGMLHELSESGLILPYEVDGQQFLQVTGWQHQRIDKPQPPKYPGPDDRRSKSIRGMFADGREGKGKEGKGVDRESDAPDGAPAPSAGELPLEPQGPSPPAAPQKEPPTSAETDLFRRGREVLGSSAGGLIARLLKAKGGNVALARAALEQASTKSDPREYVGAIIRGAAETASERPYSPIV